MTASTSRTSPAGARPAALVALLAAAAVLAALLVYQAQAAARSHRHAAEQALRDYAAFAGWELARKTDDALSDSLNASVARALFFNHHAVARRRRDLPAVLAVLAPALRREAGWCGCPEGLHTFFAIALPEGRVAAAGSPLPGDVSAWVRREMVPRARRAAADVRAEGREVAPAGQEARFLSMRPADAIWARDVPHGRDTLKVIYTMAALDTVGALVFGFVMDPAAVAGPVVRTVLDSVPLLPPSLVHGAPNERTLAVVALVPGGDTAYRSPGPFPEALAATSVRRSYLSLTTRVAVRPEVADALVIGGLPRSRLPLLGATLALVLGLLGVAVAQLRRQSELVRLRGDFVAGVSHELRTPLAQIRLFADLLGSGRLGEEQRARSVRIIGDEARRLTHLVENVLRFGRAERADARAVRAPHPVAPLLADAVEAFAPLAHAAGAEVRLAPPPEAAVPVDPDAFRQVLVNLLDNAVKYGPRGQTVEVAAAVGPGGVLRVRVDDRGPGVPPGERERVWQPFYRMERDRLGAVGGSGIGLAVVCELVEEHGGRVEVEDAPGGGARFTLELPGAEAPGAAPDPEPAATGAGRAP